MKKILFQGDSITDCVRDREETGTGARRLGSGYPVMVAAQLAYEHPGEYEFVNRGISGNRSADLYARVKLDTINLAPDYMSVLIGVNDVWAEWKRKNGVSAERYELLLDCFLSDVRAALPAIRLMVLEPYIVPGSATTDDEENPGRWDYMTREIALRQAAARRVAEKHGAVFVPLQSAFDEAYRRAPDGLWTWDGVHPCPQGHELIKREWLRGFAKLS